jgi:hypothetical protein
MQKQTTSVLERCRTAARTLAVRHALGDAGVTVTATALKPAEAIGAPRRKDFPILAGREVMIEARLGGTRGQAFTDLPLHFVGTLNDALGMELGDNGARAVFVATLNALYAQLGLVNGTVHCKNDAPEECAAEMARRAAADGVRRVGLIGFNPAIAEALVAVFGARHVRCSDLNPATIGSAKFGVTILDGRSNNAALMKGADLVLATGTTFINDTAARLLHSARAAKTRLVFYGVTCAAICCMLQLERWCFRPEDGGTPTAPPGMR